VSTAAASDGLKQPQARLPEKGGVFQWNYCQTAGYGPTEGA